MTPREVAAALLALLMVVTSCMAASVPTPENSTSSTAAPTSSTATTRDPVTTVNTLSVATTSTTKPGPVLGLITQSGVTVAVIRPAGTGFVVMTPCGFETEITGGQPLGPTTVVLDPGHGGPVDTGAVGQNGVPEKQVNLDVAEEAALVELGYMSNAPEAELFTTPTYHRVAGLAIADAIEEYLETDNTGSGFVEGRVFDPQPGVSQDVCTDPELG